MKRFMWSFLALLIVACVGVYLAGGFECFAASPGTAGAAIPGDRTKAYITLGILIVAALLFVTEALPLPITAMLVPVGLSSTGVLTSKVAFSYFGDNTVVLFMAMFIIGESTFVTGFADRVGQMALKLSKGDMKKLLLFSMIAVGGLSTVLSNTGTTAVAVPMIMGMCASAKVAPSKILMPVAFASSLGGTVTLVGTPPNGIINLIRSASRSSGSLNSASSASSCSPPACCITGLSATACFPRTRAAKTIPSVPN